MQRYSPPPTIFVAEHDTMFEMVFWSVQVRCPDCALPLFCPTPACSAGVVEWETEKALLSNQ